MISFERLLVGLGADHRQHRAEDLFLVDVHVRVTRSNRQPPMK
jgi:hypothetical protein